MPENREGHGKTYTLHCVLDIDAPWSKWKGFLCHRDTKVPLTQEEFEEARAQFKAKGYTCFPSCDNIKPDGTCAGHEVVDA